MKPFIQILVFFLGATLFVNALGDNRPSDLAMENAFQAKYQTFSKLLRLFQDDEGAVTYVGKGEVVTYNKEIDKDRKTLYLRYVKDLNCVAAYSNDQLTLWIWGTGLTIASPSESKGYYYIPTLGHLEKAIVPSIDEVEKSGKLGIFLKPLKNNWYIVYMNSD